MKIIFLGTTLFVFLLACGLSPQREGPFATEETENSNFKVKISAFRERRKFGGALAGAYYVFEAKRRNENAWKEFMTYPFDDPIPIDPNSIVFVNEKIGYVFMMRKFAVTTNEGMNWSIWDLREIEPLRDDLSCRIQKANVTQNGMGTIDIKCNKTTFVLSTRDFGVTWNQ